MQGIVSGTVATAAVLGAATGLWWHAAMWPESQMFGPQLVASHNPMEIALTYDDGPNGDTTRRLLDVLAESGTRATFFLIGKHVRQQPEIARRVAEAGHLVGNHTMTHPVLTWQSLSRIRAELSECNAVIEDAIGQPVRYFRPPHGARRPAVLRVAREFGLTPVQWNVTAHDWNPISAEKILGNIDDGIASNRRKGRSSNVLLHDGGQHGLGQPRMPSVEATRQVVEKARAAGMQFVTVDAWG